MQGFLFNGGVVNLNGIEHTKEQNFANILHR